MRPTLAILCLSLLSLVSVQGADKRSPGSVWLVESDTTRLYLCGTIHLLRAQDYPLPASYDSAYADAQRLVFELPPGSAHDPALATKMMAAGVFSDGKELNDVITEATVTKLNDWARDRGVPRSTFKAFRPWLAALTISMTEYIATGAEPGKGVDVVFEARAKKDRKPGEGLETIEKQVGLFSKLTEQEQVELLEQTLAETKSLPETFEKMITSWREGDAEGLYKMLNEEAEKYPALMAKFLTDRNQAWIKPLKRHLSGREPVMVLVGSGHLGGPKGVIELLRQQGYKITKMTE